MSKHYLEPASDYVLVVDTPQENVIGDIQLPDNQRQQEMCFGTVVAAGPLATATKPEDQICYGPYAGKGVIMTGLEFRLLREGQIEAYIRKSQ